MKRELLLSPEQVSAGVAVLRDCDLDTEYTPMEELEKIVRDIVTAVIVQP